MQTTSRIKRDRQSGQAMMFTIVALAVTSAIGLVAITAVIRSLATEGKLQRQAVVERLAESASEEVFGRLAKSVSSLSAITSHPGYSTGTDVGTTSSVWVRYGTDGQVVTCTLGTQACFTVRLAAHGFTTAGVATADIDLATSAVIQVTARQCRESITSAEVVARSALSSSPDSRASCVYARRQTTIRSRLFSDHVVWVNTMANTKFATSDSIAGSIHLGTTNESFKYCGTPTIAKDTSVTPNVSYRIETLASTAVAVAGSCTSTGSQVVSASTVVSSDALALPVVSASDYASIANATISTAVTSPAAIVLSGGNYTLNGGSSTAIPSSGVLYVSGPATISQTTSLTGKLTIAASGDIAITSSLQLTSQVDDMLSIVSTAGNINIGFSAASRTIEALLLAPSLTAGQGIVQTASTDLSSAPAYPLYLYGAIVARELGALGTINATTGATTAGYSKSFTYDPRLATSQPPFALSQVRGRWIRLAATTVSPFTPGISGIATTTTAANTAPTVTFTSPATPTVSRTLSYTVTFNKRISGLASSDFSNAGTATSCTFSIPNSYGITFTLTVVCSSDGTVIVRLAASSVIDSLGLTGPSSASDASTVTISSVATALAMETQPLGGESPTTFSTDPKIKLVNSSGDLVTTTGTTITVTASGGTLTGTTSMTTTGGYAEFTNLTLTASAGTYTLTFASTGLTSVTSASVTVTVAACTPTSSTSGGYTTLSFTTTGTCTWVVPTGVTAVQTLVVGGGGGGGGGGCDWMYGRGGGGGGVSQTSSTAVTAASNVTVVVGSGGATAVAKTGCPGTPGVATVGTQGGTSSFGSISSTGGFSSPQYGSLGGASGVGDNSSFAASGLDTADNQGCVPDPDCSGGGGGGAGGAASQMSGGTAGKWGSTDSRRAGTGGPGVLSSISGSSLAYGAGAFGVTAGTFGTNYGCGGSGGAGYFGASYEGGGCYNGTAIVNPLANRGGGGLEVNGGSGVVIVKYQTATKLSTTTSAAGSLSSVAFTTQPVITIQDASSATVTSSTAIVTASISSGGTLIGTATATAVNGIATFSNLGITASSGTYTITYSSGSLTSTSQTISHYGDLLAQCVANIDDATVTETTILTVTKFANRAALLTAVSGGTWYIQIASGSGSFGIAHASNQDIYCGNNQNNTSPNLDSTSTTWDYFWGGAGNDTVNTMWKSFFFGGDGNDSITTANESSFFYGQSGTDTNTTNSSSTVDLGAATKLWYTTAAAGAVSGVAFTTQPVIAVQGEIAQNGSWGFTLTLAERSFTVRESTATVTASVSSGTLIGTTTATAVNGVATFSNLGITASAGTYTITYSSGSLATTSHSVTVSPTINGGPGVFSSITGTSVMYGSGGAGRKGSAYGSYYATTGTLTLSGTDASLPTDAPANSGRGGQDRASGSSGYTAGGSGIVVLKYADSFAALTVGSGLTSTSTTSGGYRIYSFTAGTGTVTVPSGGITNLEYLIVGGGASGNRGYNNQYYGLGGGGGGVTTGTGYSAPGGSYTIVVGAGGLGCSNCGPINAAQGNDGVASSVTRVSNSEAFTATGGLKGAITSTSSDVGGTSGTGTRDGVAYTFSGGDGGANGTAANDAGGGGGGGAGGVPNI